MKIYMIPGLAADARLFSALNLGEGFEVKVLQWVAPGKNESLEDYAKRLVAQINADEPHILSGVSLGGVLAQEVSRYTKPEKVIIISSVKTKNEFPPYFHLIRMLRLHKLFPAVLTKKLTDLLKHVFGKMNKKEYYVFKNMLLNTDNEFIEWSEDAILNWKNEKLLPNVIHIHGTADRVFPPRYIKNAIWLEGGGHYMIMHNARKLSKIIREVLEKQETEDRRQETE